MVVVITFSVIVAIETLIIGYLFYRLKNRNRYYKKQFDKIFKSWNTAYRQMKGMEELFNER